MMKLRYAAILCGGISVLAVAAATLPAPVIAQTAQSYSFGIPSKPLLSALSDFTATTGIQVVRPSSIRISGRSQAVSGDYPAEVALRALLSGSGLTFQFAGPRTVALHAVGGEEVNFTPAGDGIAIEPIEVSVTGGNAPAFQGVGRVEITAEQLALSDPRDLQDLFAAEPGISVGSSIPMSQKVYVHGIEETNLAVTVDGSRQNNKVFHHSGTNLIDPTLMKAVRVDAGVAPADAGPGALGGSIAYETKDARDLLRAGENFGGFVTGSYDTNSETFTTGLSLYGARDGLEALGYLNMANGGEFEDGGGETVAGTSSDLLSVLAKLAYETDGGHRFEASYEKVDDDATRPVRANLAGFYDPSTGDSYFGDSTYTLERSNTVLRYTLETPDDWWDPEALIAYSNTTLIQDGLYPGETDSLNGKIQNTFALASGTVVAGLDFYDDKASYSEPGWEGQEKATNIGLYVQARLEPLADTRLSFGARGDIQWFEGTNEVEYENSGLSGNVSVEQDITEFLTAKAGYSHTFAGIPLAEAFLLWNNFTYDPNPEPVTADNFNASLIARYEGFSFEGGVFRTEVHDARQPLTNQTTGVANVELESEGFEIGAGYEWGSGFVTVKYADVSVKLDGRPPTSYEGNYLTMPMGRIIGVQFAHTFEEWRLTIGGDAEIALENDDLEGLAGIDDPPYLGQSIPGYEVVNLFVQYVPENLQDLTLRAEVNNIFDETYSKRGTYGQEYETVIPLREPGRSFLLSAKAQF